MKVIYIECSAEELKANRTILDNLADTFSAITEAICGGCKDSEENEESEVNE